MLQDAVPLVLSRYPLQFQPRSPVQRLGNAGGSSGATLWRYRAEVGELALRAWPMQGPTLARLEMIHCWVRELSSLEDVPVPIPIPATDGRTVQQQSGVFWEVAPWLPGDPVSEDAPAPGEIRSAFAALACVHRRLCGHGQHGVSPGLNRILEFERLADSGLDRMAAALEALAGCPAGSVGPALGCSGQDDDSSPVTGAPRCGSTGGHAAALPSRCPPAALPFR